MALDPAEPAVPSRRSYRQGRRVGDLRIRRERHQDSRMATLLKAPFRAVAARFGQPRTTR